MTNDPQRSHRRPGRPESPITRDEVLDVARALFLEGGPDVSIDAISTRAGISKPVLYRRFRDKDELVEAVLEREARRAISDDQHRKCATMEFDAVLRAFGNRYVALSNDQLMGWGRLLAAMAPRYPDLPGRFFEMGPKKHHEYLIDCIAGGVEKGVIDTENPREAAGDLLGFWLGMAGLEIHLRVRAPMSDEEIASRVDRGVVRFMHIYGVPNAI